MWKKVLAFAAVAMAGVIAEAATQKVQLEERVVLGQTPLHKAALRGSAAAVEELISKGAAVNAKDVRGRTPLHRAAEVGAGPVAKLLIAKGALVNAEDVLGRTPLHRAAEYGHKAIAELLLAKGAKIDAPDKSGRTPLARAAVKYRTAAMRLLLASGASASKAKLSALHVAALKDDEAKVRQLIRNGAAVDVADALKRTSLHLAAMADSATAVKVLLEKGAQPNAGGAGGFTPLHLAALAGRASIAELLISKGARVDAKNLRGWTPLHYATRHNHKTFAKLLLAKGADVNAKCSNHITALHLAAEHGLVELAELLIAKGAQVNAREEARKTPWDLAVYFGKAQMVKLLEKHEGGTGWPPSTRPAPEPAANPAPSALPAFPGAEGFGAISKGGRGGRVIKVTNLKSHGPGSLNAACRAEGPRIVIFEVSGVIRGGISIRHPFLTIAGQTAPGAGITIEGAINAWRRNASDIIIRHIRLRPKMRRGADCFMVAGKQTRGLILDHCSMSWSCDETVNLGGSHDVTIQWCSIEESDNSPASHEEWSHNYAFIATGNTGRFSMHHNLWAHHHKRVPSASPYVPNLPYDFRNNVVYDCYIGLTHDGHGSRLRSPINMVGNYYERGPGTVGFNGQYDMFPFGLHRAGTYHLSANYIRDWGYVGDPRDRRWRLSKPKWVQDSRGGTKLAKPARVAPVTTHTALEAYRLVTEYAGCFPRDRVTRRTVQEVRLGTGKWGRDAPTAPTDKWFMKGLTVTKAPKDFDGDGMPDAWEKSHGLSANDPADANKIVPKGTSAGDRHAGYTFIEFYVNELADALVAAPLTRRRAGRATH